jgi:hypothetical protein
VEQQESMLARACRPYLLLDGLTMAWQLEAWLEGQEPRTAEQGLARLRLGELVRPLEPARALALAAEARTADPSLDPSRLAALEASAYFELGAREEAVAALAEVAPGSVRELLQAIAALHFHQLAEARVRLDQLLGQAELSPDLQAEALSFRSRVRLAQEGPAGLQVDLEALGSLCATQRAPLTACWVTLLRQLTATGGWEEAGRLLAKLDLDRLLEQSQAGIDVSPVELGLIPVWVHGTFVQLREQPDALVERLVLLAALLWRFGRPRDSHRTIVFGVRLAERLVGPAALAPLLRFQELLRGRAGQARWAEFDQELEEEASRVLQTRRPQETQP